MSISRLMNTFNLGYFGLSIYVYNTAKLAMPDLVYFCAGGLTAMNAVYHYFLKKMRKTAANRIEWDVESEQFVIVKPNGVSGEISRFLPVNELKFDSKSTVRDCIYFDAVTGEGIATVNRGQWYNLMLFMHLMQKNQRKNEANVQIPNINMSPDE
jgi:hypothetical protein